MSFLAFCKEAAAEEGSCLAHNWIRVSSQKRTKFMNKNILFSFLRRDMYVYGPSAICGGCVRIYSDENRNSEIQRIGSNFLSPLLAFQFMKNYLFYFLFFSFLFSLSLSLALSLSVSLSLSLSLSFSLSLSLQIQRFLLMC